MPTYLIPTEWSGPEPTTVPGILKKQIGISTFMELGATKMKNFTAGIQFEMKTHQRRLRKVQVDLTPADTYTIKHCDLKGFDFQIIEGIYADNIREVLLGLLEHKAGKR